MIKKIDLVLDIAGVIASNFSPIIGRIYLQNSKLHMKNLLSLERKSVMSYGLEKLLNKNFGRG
ncbi:hypothetical protein [Metabacillus halosaccharovorans]|uniref:hypothetical protein n=1 Tax=Metabacillus halosaccharovorans TaxID=930124 RepID=UPI003735ADAE